MSIFWIQTFFSKIIFCRLTAKTLYSYTNKRLVRPHNMKTARNCRNKYIFNKKNELLNQKKTQKNVVDIIILFKKSQKPLLARFHPPKTTKILLFDNIEHF